MLKVIKAPCKCSKEKKHKNENTFIKQVIIFVIYTKDVIVLFI